MKFFILTTFAISSSLFAQAGRIDLSLGQVITLNNTVISCNVGGGNPNNPSAECNRLKSMTEDEVYRLGSYPGIGSCWIINNDGWYGIMSNGVQISPTYSSASNGNSSYTRTSYSASTGFVQSVCSGKCSR